MHMRFSIALAAGLAVVSLTACGQKGALYLRDQPPPGLKLPRPPEPKPVPYPAEPSDDSAAEPAARH